MQTQDSVIRSSWLSAAGLESLLVAVLAFIALTALFLWFPVLYDTDSYYHLAIARTYGSFGIPDSLPWARFSLMHEGFGDKEFLFHLLTAPFTWLGAEADSGISHATTGGRIALAFWNSLIVFLLAYLGHRSIGRPGLLLPILVWLGSLEFLTRATRLRPELLSLALILVALLVAARGRYRLLMLVALIYTLSYTAFHTLLVVCVIWFVQRAWTRRRFDFALLLYPTLGCLLGLVLHPHFPHNLVIWKVQSIDYFRYKAQLDIGVEILPGRTDELLLHNLPLLLALGLLWLTRRRTQRPADRDSEQERLADWSAVSAAAFVVLYFLGRRFAVYAAPFLAIWVVAELGRRGATTLHGLELPFGEPKPARLPQPLTRIVLLPLVLLAILLPAGYRLWGMGTARGGELSREQDWRAAGEVLPPGARVAAEWGRGQLYLYYAPQATFLNVLDPVFMAVPFPSEFEIQRRLFRSLEADVPVALALGLDSEFVMLSEFHDPPELLNRLDGDPRMKGLYRGYTRVYQSVPVDPAVFTLDWHLVPPERSVPVALESDISKWPLYPARSVARPDLRGLEGYVDIERLLPPSAEQRHLGGCVSLVRDPDGGGIEGPATWELAPWHHTSVWSDDRLLLAARTTQRAVLGQGYEIEIPNDSRLTVTTCRDPATGYGGFYLRRLP